MIFKISRDIKFSNFYKRMNIFSLILIFLSVLFLFIKGLNFGVDFKGGTLIEIRTNSESIKISEIRESFMKMNLGDVNVKNFGKKNDYLVKIEATKSEDEIFIKSIIKILISARLISLKLCLIEICSIVFDILDFLLIPAVSINNNF